jgi:hypothetical protein
MCHWRRQTDQALVMAARHARIIMDQAAKNDALNRCKALQKKQSAANSGVFLRPLSQLSASGSSGHL